MPAGASKRWASQRDCRRPGNPPPLPAPLVGRVRARRAERARSSIAGKPWPVFDGIVSSRMVRIP